MAFIAWINQHYEEKGPIKWLAFFLELIAAVVLFFLMVLTCADVVGRYFLNNPVKGATELTEMGLAVVLFSAMPVITWRGGHIVVDLIDSFLPNAVIKVLVWISTLLVSVSLYFAAVRVYEIGARSLRRGITSDFLHIPVGLVIQYIAVLSWITSAGLIIYSILNSINLHNKNKPKAKK